MYFGIHYNIHLVIQEIMPCSHSAEEIFKMAYRLH